MALCSSSQLHMFLVHRICCNYGCQRITKKNVRVKGGGGGDRRLCSAIAIDAPPSALGSVAEIRWGSVKLKGARDEMEDETVIINSDGFSYAAVLDGHCGFSSAKFLREELYKECVAALQGGHLLNGSDFKAIKKALTEAFENADAALLKWLETSNEEIESGTTATVIFVREDVVFISHVGDSCVVLSKSGKAEVLTNSHRPYGNNAVSRQEIKRINEAGGWIVNGRICGDISVSRAFGDMRFKNKKYEMLEKGVEEGRWTEKFVSRIRFNGDLVVASPDVSQVSLGPDAEFILLASDGLWDYIKSSEAVNFVRNHLRQHGDVQMASEALAQLALNRYSQDNVSIIIADLGRTEWQNLPAQQQNFVYEWAQALATIGIVSLGIWMSSLFSF
ncbi:protein phosphatase 2C 57 [Henckelia pumila]|uniref:protein phosphatase 2C 57 n=1 Tax=Henckelia pumila TaxID=405737 RepID=UPI003C6DC6FB